MTKIQQIALNDGISLFCADFALAEKFSENLLDNADKRRLKENPNLVKSLKFRASRVLKFEILQKSNFFANSKANLGENLGRNLDENLRLNLSWNLRQNLGENLKQNLNENLSENLKQNLSKFFCLSHTKNLVAIATAPFKIGFDVEILRRRKFKAQIDFCFNEFEKMRFEKALKKGDFVREFYEIFTAKEAIIKLLNLEFSDFDKVGFNENEILPNKKIQISHHKFSFLNSEFMASFAFLKN